MVEVLAAPGREGLKAGREAADADQLGQGSPTSHLETGMSIGDTLKQRPCRSQLSEGSMVVSEKIDFGCGDVLGREH